MDRHDEKQLLRGRMKEILRALSIEEKGRASLQIVDHLKTRFPAVPRNTLAAFVPMRDEPDINAYVTWCVDQGVCLVLPDTAHRTFQSIIPQEHDDVFDQPIHLLLVPGLAFTHTGKRLGRGGGRYDRVIAQVRQNHPSCLIVGVCFAQQLLDDLPTDPHDQLMDEVIFA